MLSVALSEYHLLAGIAAVHATAPSFDVTDWPQVVSLYDALAARNRSPVIALNRAVARSFASGPASVLDDLTELAGEPVLRGSHLVLAARADCLRRLERYPEAARAYREAAALAPAGPSRRFLEAAAGDPQSV